MAKTEERIQVLNMIESGKISAEEGAELLKALTAGDRAQATSDRSASLPRWFRVRVTDTRDGKEKVNVNIPIGLVNVGIRMGARFVPELDDVRYRDLMAQIDAGKQGRVLDVTDEEGIERVEVFVE